MLARFIAILLLGMTIAQPFSAIAGRNCDETAPNAAKTQKAIRFATQVRDSLDLSGANVALIGRVGSDQSKRGIRYTHVGYLLRDHPAGPWTVVHQLNACGTGNSDLFDEGLANFFLDDLFDFETRIVIPAPAVQESLARVLVSSVKRSVHEPSYSSIANPWSTKYQNSNGWALEIFAAAAAPAGEVTERSAAQRWLKDNGYRPSQISIGAGERAGARLFTPHIRFGDHPDTAWQTQIYDLNSGDTVIDFVRRIDPDSRTLTQRLDARPIMAQKSVVQVRAPIVEPTAPPAAKPAASVAALAIPSPTGTTANGQSRAQILQAMQGLIVPYACRPQGYLKQCRQLDRGDCATQVSDAVLRCFATVSDQQLFAESEQVAMQQMQEVGYCAVEAVDSAYAARGKQAMTAQGRQCPPVRSFK